MLVVVRREMKLGNDVVPSQATAAFHSLGFDWSIAETVILFFLRGWVGSHICWIASRCGRLLARAQSSMTGT
jgi:hypothetical protein